MRMSKKKEIVPKFRFPKYVNSEQWISTELSSLLDYERPDLYIVESDNYKNEGIPVLTANKSFILGYTDEKNNIYSCVPVIIFDDFTTEKKYVDFPFKVKSSAIKILKPKGNNVLKFVFELMNTINFEAKEHKRYYISTYQKLFVCVPKDVKEQQKIADCLSSIDELINAESKKLKALKKYKKGLMQKLFPAEGKTLPEWRFLECKNTYEIKRKRLADVCYYKSSALTTNDVKMDGKYNLYDANKIIGKVNIYASEDRYITIIKDGAGVGRVRLMDGYTNFVGTMGMINNNEFVTIDYLYYLLQTIDFRVYAIGGTIPHIYFRDYSKKEIFLPHIGEQQKIADCLSEIDTIITEQSNKVEQLKIHKKGLMQGLFPSLEEVDV
ncbi:type I restriction/modification system, specificity subunit [Campylobacter lari]|uniref:restriction endonuclease subunit S n=1 Tax=Campylobacter lari TaxID=201 RepID=UPI0021538B0F|nr:restriction endonuclease subunit S [Campylobacter lari]MCR6529825.1 restriction endonuclease subunit S [Campylobacter lari]